MPTAENNSNITVLCQSMLATLDSDIDLPNGIKLLAGSKVLVLPQTIADCILTPDGTSLAEAWPNLSKEGHGHEALTTFATELVRLSTRQTTSEETLIGYSAALVKQSNCITDARMRLEGIATQVGYLGASTVSVMANPQFEFEELTENAGEISFAVSSESLLKNGKIDHFLLTIPELSISGKKFEAIDGAAQIAFTPFGYMSNQKLSVAVCAVDNYGNRSRTTLKTTTLVVYGIQPPTIVAPLDGAIVDDLTPTVILEPMQVIGDLSDTPKYVRVQVAKDSLFQDLAFDNGTKTAPTEDNSVPIIEGLEAGKTYFARARWTGDFLGDSPWSRAISFKTTTEEAGE